MSRLFLDHNATTPLKPGVRDAMIAAMELGNPSSVHEEGRKAKAAIECARSQVCKALDAPEIGCIFNSGGTESINTVLWGMAKREKDPVKTIFVSAIEHDAAINCSKAVEASGLVKREVIPVKPNGEIDFAWLQSRLETYDAAKEGPFLAAIMLANNENGVVQDIAAIAPTIFQQGGFLFVDAIQAIGKIPVSFNQLQADFMTVSGHKIAGPKGVGALLTKPGIPFEPLLQGGGQEQRRRVGTENVIGIVGLGAAAEAIDVAHLQRLSALRDKMIAGLEEAEIAGLKVWGKDAANRLPNTVCFSAPGFASQTQVMALDLAGVSVSAGSACSSGKVKASHVVTALGASEAQATCTLRVSMGWDTPDDAAERFLQSWMSAYHRAVKEKAA